MLNEKEILLCFYAYSQKNKPFRRLVDIINKFSSAVFFVIYVAGAVFLIVSKSDAEDFATYFLTPLTQLLTTMILRRTIKRERPFDSLALEPPPGKSVGAKRDSFPSNHSSSSGIIAFSCMYVFAPTGVFVFALAVITGLSRIFSGAHYPSDVFAGFVLSGIFAFIGYNLIPTLLM